MFAAVLSLLFMTRWTSYLTGNLRNEEHVVFFPTLGREISDNKWEINIHGRIFEPDRREKRRRAALAVLRGVLKIHREDKEMLNRRMTPFLVNNNRWKTVSIKLNGQIYRLPRSAKNGHFQQTIELSLGDEVVQNGVLSFEAITNDERKVGGEVQLLNRTGLSVISDIDDTIKISNVSNTKALLSNTFLKDFKAVPGMSDIYQRLSETHDASFHFVSSSPWQLYGELEEFRKNSGFPRATYHLKSIRIKDKSLLNLKSDPFKTKTAIISEIMETYPQRRFLFVGDSGEKDPEVYGALARKHPDRVVGIWIRNVTEGDDVARMEEAFAQVPTELWKVFCDPSEIKPENRVTAATLF